MLAGASPLGDMPLTSEVASLGLPTVAESENPMLSIPGVWSSAGAKACSLSTSGGKFVEVTHTGGFSLGHGFPLIPAKLHGQENRELGVCEHGRATSRQSRTGSALGGRAERAGLLFKDPQEEGAGGRLEGLGGLVNLV